MAAKLFGLFLKSLANKEIDLDTDVLKAMLCTSAYTPNQDTHQYKSSVTGEVAGTGYTAGGVALTGVTVVYDAPSNTLTLDADDPTWPASTITARYVVVYDSTPATDATRPLLMYDDFTTDQISAAGAFTYGVNAAGLLTVTAA